MHPIHCQSRFCPRPVWLAFAAVFGARFGYGVCTSAHGLLQGCQPNCARRREREHMWRFWGPLAAANRRPRPLRPTTMVSARSR